MHVHDGFGLGGAAGSDGAAALTVFGSLLLLWGIYHVFALLAGRRMDRAGSLSAAWATERLATWVLAAGASIVVYATLVLGWLDAARNLVGDLVLVDELLAASPFILLVLATWWSGYPITRRLKEALIWRHLHEGVPLHPPPTRAQHVISQARFHLLSVLTPMSLLTAWEEVVLRVPAWAGWEAPPRWWLTLEAPISWAGIVLIISMVPALLRRVWDTTELEEGSIREQSLDVCRRYGVKVRGPFLWRTHGTMLNGAILGLFYPFRYMLFTDALLERLTRQELEGVIAHEVAHVYERHMVWLGVLVLASVLAAGWIGAGAAYVFAPALSVDAMWPAILALGGTVLVFGWVSRRFEWQADAFAVRHLTPSAEPAQAVTAEAAASMVATLQAVADLNGIRTERFTFRHGSIEQRQRRILALVGRPVARLPIDRQVKILKLVGLILVIAGLLPAMLALLLELIA